MNSQTSVDREFVMDLVEFIMSTEHPSNVPKVPNLSISNVEYNETGMYVYFGKAVPAGPEEQVSRTMGSSIYIDVEDMKHGMGCQLYIDDGVISLLECFSHAGETIPRPIRAYKFSELR